MSSSLKIMKPTKNKISFNPPLFLLSLAAVLLFGAGTSFFLPENGVTLTARGIILSLVICPAAEEFIFRGVILSLLEGSVKKYGGFVAVSVSSLLFMLIHSYNAYPIALFSGIVFGIMSLGDGLLPITSAVVHSSYNGVLALSVLLNARRGLHITLLPVAVALTALGIWLFKYRRGKNAG